MIFRVIGLIVAYTFIYTGVSKYAPKWTGGKTLSLYEASGLSYYFTPPTATKTTATGAQLASLTQVQNAGGNTPPVLA